MLSSQSGRSLIRSLIRLSPQASAATPASYGYSRSRTSPAGRERSGAHLESVLGATPQEFESPILRHL